MHGGAGCNTCGHEAECVVYAGRSKHARQTQRKTSTLSCMFGQLTSRALTNATAAQVRRLPLWPAGSCRGADKRFVGQMKTRRVSHGYHVSHAGGCHHLHMLAAVRAAPHLDTG